MEVTQKNKCVKFCLPNGKTVDVLTPVLDKWTQIDEFLPENGGYILEYQHIKIENITLDAVSYPYFF